MIFGKSRAEEEQEEQARLARQYGTIRGTFAFFPTKLIDGRMAWMQLVYYCPNVVFEGGKYVYRKYWDIVYWSTEKEAKDFVERLKILEKGNGKN